MHRPCLAAAALLASLWMTGLHAQPVADEGRKLFTAGAPPLPACALCHTFKKAGASGQIGPDLDDLQPDAARVEKALRNGIGPMPAFTGLSEAQIATLVRYVAGGPAR